MQKFKSTLFFKIVTVLFFVLYIDYCLSAQDYFTMNDDQNQALLYGKEIKQPLYSSTYQNNNVENSKLANH